MVKLIQYRSKCIGCGICFEMQPELWRMSKKDGKATLLGATEKKAVFIQLVNRADQQRTIEVTRACPTKIIKLI
jgi:ferredoxin